MPVDPYIARGAPPIDLTNTFAQIAMLKQRDRSLINDEQRNKILDLARQDDATRQDADRSKAAEREKATQALARIEWALNEPSTIAALRADPEAVAEFQANGVDLSTVDDTRAKQMLMVAHGKLAASLGVRPAEQKDPEYRTLGNSIYEVGGGGVKRVAHEAPTYAPPSPQAPNRDVELANWWRNASPEDRAAYEATHPRDKKEPGGEFEAANTNSIRGLVTTAFNGMYDPISGNISGIKREDLPNLNRVTARASQIYQESSGQKPHAVAVQEALEELRSGGAPKPAPAKPGAAPKPTAGRQVRFPNQASAEAALAAGHLKQGDTVVINGVPAFKVE